MRYLDAAQVAELLDYPTLIAGLHRLHREETEVLDDLLLEQPAVGGSGTDRFFLRAAWQRGRALGAKVITIFPNNPDQHGKPSVQAVYLLFDGEAGSPVLGLDGTVLTGRKTAADSALGSSLLAREEVGSMLMVGAGAMAPELIRAHLSVRPSIRRVAIWNRTPERARQIADRLSLDGIDLRVAEDLENAVRSAELISCATMSNEPLIRGEWLQAGTHLDLIGAYTPTMREADDAVLQRGRLFVDNRKTAGETGELMIPRAAGVIDENAIQADLFQLCRSEHPGRENATEITVFKNGGGGHLDLMTARIAQEQADYRRRVTE